MGCCSEVSPAENPLPNKPRGCTDILWLILFILFLFLLIFIASFAFVYGSPLRLLNGYDSFGNTCGTSRNDKIGNLSHSGLDTSDKPFLFYMNATNIQESMKLCVKKCPDHNMNSIEDIEKFYRDKGSMLCSYDFNFEDVHKNRMPKAGIESAFTSPQGPCPSLPVYLSDPVLHRCIPRPVRELVTSLYAALNSWDALEQVLADLYASWKEILALSFLAFVLSLIMVSILHLLASVVAWIFMLIVSIAAIGGTVFLWWTYINIYKTLNVTPPERMLEESVRNEHAFLVYSIVATVITVIILLLVIAMRKRVQFLAALFEDTAHCLGSVPALFMQPLITFLALLAFFAFWISVIVCLATSSLTFVEFVDPAWVRYFWWVYLIGLIWISEFIIACQQMVIAGAVSLWYFNGRTAENISPVLSSMNKLVCYHLGSVAKGSMIITLFKLPRLILTYLYARLKGNPEDNCCFRCGLKCCICCFYCFETFIRYMNHNAYTVIAMEGVSFCSAARIAFSTIGSNALRVITLNSVGDFVLFLGKCFVTAVTGSVGLIFLKQDPHLHFYAIPTLVVCIFAFFIAHCVLSLYEIVVDTLFLCVCEDERLNPDGGYWQETGVIGARRSEEGTELSPIARDGSS